MAYTPPKPEELKKLIKMSKTRALNFAYNPGPKGADLFLLDKILAADKLGRTAKKEGEGTKATFGSFAVEGRVATITTDVNLPGMSKKLRKYLKTLGYSFSVEVVDPSGNTLEKDLSEEDEASAQPEQKAAPQASPEPPKEAPAEAAKKEEPQAPEPNPLAEEAAKKEAAARADNTAEKPTESPESQPPDTAPDKLETARKAALTDRLRQLQDPVNALGTTGAPLKKAIAVVVPMLKNGEFDKVDATLAKIEQGVKKAQDAQAKKAEAAPAEAAKKETGTTADPKALVARATSLKSALAELSGNDAEGVKKQLVQALALIKARQFDAADAALTGAENAMNALAEAPEAAKKEEPADSAQEQEVTQPSEPAERAAEAPEQPQEADAAPDPQADAWAAEVGPLQAEVDAAMQARTGDLDAINRAFGFAKSQGEAGNYASAMAAAEQTRKLIKEAAEATEDARVTEAEDTTPDNIVAYKKSRLAWIATRNKLIADMLKLEMAINNAAKDNEQLQDIAAQTSDLVHYVDDLDSSLEDTMDALVNTPRGPDREALKKKAIGIIQTYRTTLDDEFFQAVDNNGFTDINIRGRALDALTQVETTLAA